MTKIPLVVVNDLDIFGADGRPSEANAELVVDPDAVLTGPVTLERLEPITRRNSQVFQAARDLQLPDLPSSRGLDTIESPDASTFRKGLRLRALERDDHSGIITRCVTMRQEVCPTERG